MRKRIKAAFPKLNENAPQLQAADGCGCSFLAWARQFKYHEDGEGGYEPLQRGRGKGADHKHAIGIVYSWEILDIYVGQLLAMNVPPQCGRSALVAKPKPQDGQEERQADRCDAAQPTTCGAR